MACSTLIWIVTTLFLTCSHVPANGNESVNTTTAVAASSPNSTVTSAPSNEVTTVFSSTTSPMSINETESNDTSDVTTTLDGSTNVTDSNSTAIPPTTVSIPAPVASNATLRSANATTTTQTTNAETATTKSMDTNTPEGAENTTTAAQLSIVEKVKIKWEEAVAGTNFSDTVINDTLIKQVSSSEIIDIIVEFYILANESELQSFLESEGVDSLAKLLLDNEIILETSILNAFNESQNASIHGFLASLYRLNDDILVPERIHELAVLYEQELPSSSGNDTDNTTTSELASVRGFVNFILSNATAKDLSDSLCRVVLEENLDSVICSITTIAPTTAQSIPGPQRFQSTWSNIISSSTYDFLSQNQATELQALTPENMTSGLVDYVNGLSSSEIKNLVDANVTNYVSSLLRRSGSAAVVLGQETVDALGGNADKEDLYYLYLNFLNNFYSREGQFENVLRGYVNASSSSIARSTSTCDTSSITASGLCCYTITTEAQNQTALRDAVCDELKGGDECKTSFNINEDEEEDEPTSSPVPNSSLSTGAIVGITIGGVVVIVIIIIIIFFLWKRSNKKKSKVNPEDEERDSENLEMDGRTSTTTHRPRTPQEPSRNGSLSN